MTWAVAPGAGWLVAAPTDSATPSSSPTYVDASATPGNVTVGAHVRKILVKFVGSASRVVITHPRITASSKASYAYTGTDNSTPRANRWFAARCVAGAIELDANANMSIGDGPVLVSVDVL